MSPSFRKFFTFYGNGNKFNLQDLLGESHKKLNEIVATILLLVEKKKDKNYILLSQRVCIFFPRMNNLHTKKTCNGSNFAWLIRQMSSVNQKSGWQTFSRRFVSGRFPFSQNFRNFRFGGK